MVRKDGAWIKQQRIKKICTHTAKEIENGPRTLSSILSWVEINIGLNRHKAFEYTLLCAKTYGWVIDEDSDIIALPEET